MRFDGFPEQTLRFLQALHDNNDKGWFEAHRADYEQYYLQPALALIEALAPVAGALDPPHKAEAKQNGSLRRIHRDTRFSKDKTPYQPRIHLVFWTGDHPNRSAGIHLVFAHDHFGYGGGHWAFEKGALERYRDAVADKTQEPAWRRPWQRRAPSAAPWVNRNWPVSRVVMTPMKHRQSGCAARASWRGLMMRKGTTSGCSRRKPKAISPI